MFNDVVLPSTTTSYALGFTTALSTAAASFTLPTLVHFRAYQVALGAGSAVTTQRGFHVDSTLIGATNNYGYVSSIPAGTNRWNLYMDGTAANYLEGALGVGATGGNAKVVIGGTQNFAANSRAAAVFSTVDPAVVTAESISYLSQSNVSAGTLPSLVHFYAAQGSLTGTVTNQYGFIAGSALIGGTNNYGFYGGLAAGTGRWNLYMAGTAANYLAGDLQLSKTVTAGGTTGAQTINKSIGTVNFAAAATSLVVTNSLVTANSIITATVGTNDTTMKSVAVVAASGSFTLYANAAATAETRVNFHVLN